MIDAGKCCDKDGIKNCHETFVEKNKIDMDNWIKLKKLYVDNHNSKDYLATPDRRLNAADALEKLLKQQLPQFVKQPKFLKQIPKEDFVKMVHEKKGSNLSSAEKSVINGLYKFMPEL